MQIKIKHKNGYLEIMAQHVIENLPMKQYMLFAKLFARYGTSEQHCEFLTLLDTYINEAQTKHDEYIPEFEEWEGKANRTIPSYFTIEHCEKQLNLVKRHMNGWLTIISRYKKMSERLRMLIS